MRIRILLYPFSLLYGLVTNLRNKLFDWQILSSQSYNLPIISVGNITVGGTGKTPLTEYLIRLLQKDAKLALLSRGYKRQTKGALLANKTSTAASIGDEPFQIKQNFPQLEVAVAEERVKGIQLLLDQTASEVILMDDAYQHRYVKPGFSILVIDYNRPMWNDFVFPAGNLRETRKGQNRADIIVVNKCPANMDKNEQQRWLRKIKLQNHQEVYFSTIEYGNAVPINKLEKTLDKGKKTIALAGIARPEPFFNYLKNEHHVIKELSFPDHHHFNNKDIENIRHQLIRTGAEVIITTEKDAVRMSDLPREISNKTWYLPIKLRILFNQTTQFEKTIHQYVRKNKSNG